VQDTLTHCGRKLKEAGNEGREKGRKLKAKRSVYLPVQIIQTCPGQIHSLTEVDRMFCIDVKGKGKVVSGLTKYHAMKTSCA
jgi:hypothetical protein